MLMKRFTIIALIASVLAAAVPGAHSQILTLDHKSMRRDSVIRDFDSRPYFGLYKDNYLIFGPPIGQKITRHNTDVKFQISISQKLTRSNLPLGTYLYLFYTQKVFWNVLENSMPMTDLNFNPGIGLTKPLFVKNRMIGKLTFMIEHESNGRDSIQSRSWNRVALAANVLVTKNLMVHYKIWAPIVDGENNRDIVDYAGFYQFGCQWYSNNRRLSAGITLVPRKGFMNFNTVMDFCFRLFKDENQYFYVQFYNGYAEGLLEYNQYHSQLRAGIVIKPKLFSEY